MRVKAIKAKRLVAFAECDRRQRKRRATAAPLTRTGGSPALTNVARRPDGRKLAFRRIRTFMIAFLAARIRSLRPPVVMARDYRLYSASRVSKRSLMSRPPAKPVSLPSEPTTRWQGAMIEIGFLPLAAPTARAALARPIWAAICP